MYEPFIVEIWGEPAGIVLKEGNAFRFHAMTRRFFELDGAQFTTPGHARLAAARLADNDLPSAASFATPIERAGESSNASPQDAPHLQVVR